MLSGPFGWTPVCGTFASVWISLSQRIEQSVLFQAGAVLEDLLLLLHSFMLSDEFVGFLQGQLQIRLQAF